MFTSHLTYNACKRNDHKYIARTQLADLRHSNLQSWKFVAFQIWRASRWRTSCFARQNKWKWKCKALSANDPGKTRRWSAHRNARHIFREPLGQFRQWDLRAFCRSTNRTWLANGDNLVSKVVSEKIKKTYPSTLRGWKVRSLFSVHVESKA